MPLNVNKLADYCRHKLKLNLLFTINLRTVNIGFTEHLVTRKD